MDEKGWFSGAGWSVGVARDVAVRLLAAAAPQAGPQQPRGWLRSAPPELGSLANACVVLNAMQSCRGATNCSAFYDKDEEITM